MALGEFELIARYFSRPVARRDVLVGVGDDAALLEVPAGQALAAATDTLVEGRHFLPDAPPESVGHQALAVNLSDLAAMGAEPAWALLALSLPEPDTHWLEGFARGFHALADRAGLTLVGGDTVRGPRVVTVQVLGFVPAGLALRRDGARPGDVLYASGSLGDAAAGLKLLRDGRRADTDSSLVRRYRFAEPRLALGMALRGVASAAIDVSDGLLGDLGKLCDASGVGAILELEQLPLSRALLASFDATQAERFALGGGDDYELAFAVPRAAVSEMETSLATIGRITRIGEIVTGHGVRCQRAGQTVEPEIAGYDHFG
ncbi:MAG TPA: thiamine-phosphate kinase [Steroidobacteraceae bacterium]|jgi:thiamine-monophosphate kinase|nr:thiamine-phosphate kinase [Steroidobacteraceae bacterium]